MVAKRLAALVAAVALVAAAFAFRASRNDSTAVGSPTTTGTGATTVPAAARLKLTCAMELEPICGELSKDAVVTLAVDQGAVVQDLVNHDDASTVLDVWLTLDPWPQLANAARSPVFDADAKVIGTSPLGVAVRKERVAPLQKLCGSPLTTQCLGDDAGKQWTSIGGESTWGALRPVFEKPTTSAVGLVAFAAAVVNRPTPGSLARIDLESDPTFVSWVRGAGQFSHGLDPNQGAALEQASGRVRYDVVVTTEQQQKALAPSFVFLPFPTGQAHLVMATRTGVTVPPDLLARITELAKTSGWSADVAPTALPTPAEVAGLQQIWTQATA